MIVAIMQPYLFPYIGYFQLMAACDVFVVYDDAQYRRGGWINRNRILLNGAPRWFSLPVSKAPVETQIGAMRYLLNDETLGELSERLAAAYRKAPHFESARNLFDEVMSFADDNVARFNAQSLRRISQSIGLDRTFVRSSELGRDTALKAQAAVVDICQRLGARRYVNAMGGTGLYDAASFAAAGIQLAFVKPEPQPYPQFGAEHVPNLSILDLLMFLEPAQIHAMLTQYSLVVPEPDGERL
jgi:hypothetical protein